MYFAFLATYTKCLTPVAVLGASFHFLGERYSPLYSIVIVLWATFFAEYWAVCERKLAVRWGSHGSSGFTKASTKQTAGAWWWIAGFGKLSRLGASVAVLLGFMCTLAAITVVMFILEAFLAILYKGPGSQIAVWANFLSPARRADIITIAYHPGGNLRCERPDCAGHLSVHCHPQHIFRTTHHLFRLHVFANNQTIYTIDNCLVPRYHPFCVHLSAIRPRSPWLASPPTLQLRLYGNHQFIGRGGGRTIVGARFVQGLDKIERDEIANADVCFPCDGSVGECVPRVGNALRHQVVTIAHQPSHQGGAVRRSIGHPGREAIGPCQGRSLYEDGLRYL